jgi:hypothetical protein
MLIVINKLIQILKSKQCGVLFVCSASVDEIWVRSTILECVQQKLHVSLVICDKNFRAHEIIKALYGKTNIKIRLGIKLGQAAKIKSKAVVTASSGLTRDIFPTSSKIFVHMPHSFASLHVIYPEGAFDGYSHLFAVGAHHVKEFNEIIKRRGLVGANIVQVGYGKLDVLRAFHSSDSTERHALIAPSWGDGNLLEVCGIRLVKLLLSKGWKVTVRPHPIFFLENSSILKSFWQLESIHDNLKIESSLDGDGAINTATVMIGDYSGASFEFAVLRRRPVISVNVPRKIVNHNWGEYGIEPMEIYGRRLLGPIVEPNADAILEIIDDAVSGIEEKDISKFLFDDGRPCATRAVEALKQLMADL